MNEAQLEKMFKALEKSPTPSIAIKRNARLSKFIIQNTGENQLRIHLLERNRNLFSSALSRLAV